ncbi:MAG: glycosyltransferase family 4 protein [Rouxiella aceris]|uniref:glycosyltransferase family 4 protein n=1 Tax=Rouxiella aceris TaxID=2703884 RepID=UPI00283AF2CB|nr:glycosyltransferase family 4 protein [Rouxiella aceris]MDR3432618.1 glycosyltransferase family 4 protein [Rouxiella aceris]
MKKICYFINSDWYFDLHWIDRVIATQKEGFEIHVITNFLDDNLVYKFNKLGFICHNSTMDSQSMNPISFLRSACKIFYLLHKIDADIIHCITIKPCLIGGFFGRFFNKNVIISFVGLGRVFSKSNRKLNIISKIVIPFYKYMFNNTKCLISFEHERDKENLITITNMPLERTVVIDGAGVDVDKYPYTPEVIGDVPVILFASRLLKSKGLADLIASKKILESRNIYFRLDVAGIPVPGDADGIDISLLNKWSSEGVINWLGQCHDIARLIIDANIVALPSVYSEGVPRILLEAASVGRPIVAYDVGGCNSLIIDAENGYLIDRSNIDVLSNKLESLILDPELRQTMGRNGRNLVENKFSSLIILSKTLQMYRYSLALH